MLLFIIFLRPHSFSQQGNSSPKFFDSEWKVQIQSKHCSLSYFFKVSLAHLKKSTILLKSPNQFQKSNSHSFASPTKFFGMQYVKTVEHIQIGKQNSFYSNITLFIFKEYVLIYLLFIQFFSQSAQWSGQIQKGPGHSPINLPTAQRPVQIPPMTPVAEHTVPLPTLHFPFIGRNDANMAAPITPLRK